MDAERSRRRWSPFASDVALAAGAFALSASVLLTTSAAGGNPWLTTWLLVLVHTAPIAFRRRAPVGAFAVSLAAGLLHVSLGRPMVALGLASLVMTYSLAAYASRRTSMAGLLAAAVGMVAAAAVGGSTVQVDTLTGNVLVLGAAWVLGDGTRRRREEALGEQRRAAGRAVAEERLRIARELHDIVAHSMSVIAVQAGTGRMLVHDDPDSASRALRAIEDTSRQALDELRRLVGVLRAEGPDEPAALVPVPRLDDLERLVAHTVDGGTAVDVVVEGERRTVPAGVELAAYRVLQESLTNVRRHAPGAPAHVRVVFGPNELAVEVENPLVPDAPPDSGGGHGLVGMRERVSLYGGKFEAGPEDGSFRVRARIPLAADGY